MKSWIYAVMVLTAASFVGCEGGGGSSNTSNTSNGGDGGSNDGGGGSGGNPTTTTSVTTTSTTTTSTTTTTMTGTDCTQEPDFGTCANCFAEQFPEGAMVYNELVVCVICDACYTACDGVNSGCPMPPAMMNACDTATTSDADCGDNMMGCIACALGDPCMPQIAACQNNPDCVDFATAIGDCPN